MTGNKWMIVLAAGLAMGAYAPADAQVRGGSAMGQDRQQVRMAERFPQRETAARLMRRLDVEIESQRLEDVIRFIAEVTGAEIEPAWADDRFADGLDRDRVISLRVRNRTALDVIEEVLERARGEFDTYGNTWQFSPYGSLEIGPKSRLNRRKRVEIYPILDMVTELPRYDNAPQFDLNQILQGGRGGGGQSPFQDPGDQQPERVPLDERVEDLIRLLTDLVEPEQWEQNAGEGGSIRYWQGNLIVNAPDYMHRGLNGYPWWPSRLTSVRTAEGGGRWVSLDIDAPFSRVLGIENQEVSAIVGGRIIRSGDPGGGG